MSRFQKATKKKAKARIALIGPSGSGKTYTALQLAKGLGSRIAVIDTERSSASKYAGDVAEFDALDLENHDPREYVKAINDAASERYDVLVIDSLSHAWSGRGGALEQVDQAAKRSRTGNTFTAWRDVTPLHNALVDAILQFPGHVIVTMRAKTEYVMETGPNGKQTPRKVGLAPIQRDGVEYEFDIVADVDLDHTLIVSKSRCPRLSDKVISKPDTAVARALLAWLDDGVDAPVKAAQPVQVPAEPAVYYDDARAEEQARKRLESDDRANALIELIGDIQNVQHFEAFVRINGHEIRGFHQNAKARIWRRMVEVSERLGIKQADMRDMVKNAPEFPVSDDGEEDAAQ